MLAAWAGAVRQLGRAQLSHPAGVEGMDLRQYAYVVPQHVAVTMRARRRGVWSADAHFLDEGWRALEEPAELAAYAERVRGRFARWAAALAPGDLERICDGFYGRVPFADLLAVSLARAIFHLRRLEGIVRDELAL